MLLLRFKILKNSVSEKIFVTKSRVFYIKVEVKSVVRIISVHILRGLHDGILKILIELGMRI